VDIVAANGVEHSIGAAMHGHEKAFTDDHIEPLVGVVWAAGGPAQGGHLAASAATSREADGGGETT
jgi:hypothetical protein